MAAAGCGAAGGLLLLSQLNVLSTSVFSVQWSAKMIFVVIIGGIGSIEGPIVGTIVYFALQTALAQYGAWYFIVLGVVAIVIALWAPRGVWGAIAGRINLHPFPTGYWLYARRHAGRPAMPDGPGACGVRPMMTARPGDERSTRRTSIPGTRRPGCGRPRSRSCSCRSR